MGIWSILSRNAIQGSRTRHPSDDVPFPEGFRGALRHTQEQCAGCGICAYVCSPTAIRLEASDRDSTVWHYFAGQCTFCGRCVEYCPTDALDFDRNGPPVTRDPSQHRLAHAVVFPPCPLCGRPVLPMPARLLVRLYGEPVPEALQAGRRLCERCRGRASAEAMKVQIGARRCE
jgi:ferredoxin